MKIFWSLLFCFAITNVQAQTPIESAKDAVIDNDIAALEQILQNGFDINQRDEFGNTLLIYALDESSEPSSIEYLISAGADVNAPSSDSGKTPLILITSVADELQKQISSLLAEPDNSSSEQQLQQQALLRMQYTVKLLRLLIKNNADVNQETPFGTPLMNAARNEWNTQIIEILLKSGAKVNQRDYYGRTALFYAEAYKNNKIISQLMAAGADVDIKDFDGASYMEITKEKLNN